MLDAARLASNFARGRQRTDLGTDVMFQFALIRAVEIIGEAASRLPSRRPFRADGMTVGPAPQARRG
jgi:uncharacterized protein with HEPN domain